MKHLAHRAAVDRPETIGPGRQEWLVRPGWRWGMSTGGGALEEQFAFAPVACLGCGALELGACLVEATELLVLTLEAGAPADQVDGSVLRGGHEPGGRVVRDPRLWPTLEGDDECILREFLGEAHVAYDTGDSGDESGRLDPSDRVDGAMDVGLGHGAGSADFIARAARRSRPSGLPEGTPACRSSGGPRSRLRRRVAGSAWPLRSRLPSTSPGRSRIPRPAPWSR